MLGENIVGCGLVRAGQQHKSPRGVDAVVVESACLAAYAMETYALRCDRRRRRTARILRCHGARRGVVVGAYGAHMGRVCGGYGYAIIT